MDRTYSDDSYLIYIENLNQEDSQEELVGIVVELNDDNTVEDSKALEEVCDVINNGSTVCDTVIKEEIDDEGIEIKQEYDIEISLNEEINYEDDDASNAFEYEFLCEDEDNDNKDNIVHFSLLSEELSSKYDSLSDREKKIVDGYVEELVQEFSTKRIYYRSNKTPYIEEDGILCCLFCEFTNVKPTLMRQHFRRHHPSNKEKCLACNACYTRFDALRAHEMRCPSKNADLLRIARIIMKSRKKSLIPTRAERRSAKEPCPVCSKLICHANMKAHIRIHNDYCHYKCTKCTASFKTTRALNAHHNAHLGIRPYQCDQCPRAYTSDTALRAHKTDRHLQYLEVSCDQCGRTFTRKASLIEHLKIHEGKPRRHPCEQCGASFYHMSSLKEHLRKHEGLPPGYPCAACQKQFRSITGLRYHMQKHHGIDVMTRRMFFTKLPLMTDTSMTSGVQFYLDNGGNLNGDNKMPETIIIS